MNKNNSGDKRKIYIKPTVEELNLSGEEQAVSAVVAAAVVAVLIIPQPVHASIVPLIPRR